VRAIASHARRFQTARKHQEQRYQAQREAVYARGLVEWQNPSSIEAVPDSQPTSNIEVLTAEQYEEQTREEREEGLQLEISGGLRADPFESLPSQMSRSVLELVDYCKCRQA
jgi:hypothetical protein